jgi:hypothetical protein
MAINYMNIFQSKASQNLPKIGIFGLKIFHLATLATRKTPQKGEISFLKNKHFWRP